MIDVAATVLDVAGLPAPDFVNGIQQMPLHGCSMAYAFDDADAPERHETQYFEMMCNRGIYHKGWTAVTKHRTPWIVGGPLPDFDDDVWELYDTTDWTQAHDLAASEPDRLRHLQRLFLIEATKYKVRRQRAVNATRTDGRRRGCTPSRANVVLTCDYC